MNWLATPEVCIRYEVTGGGQGWVVLIHELGGSLESWDEVMPHLSGQWRVLRYDQRGSGLSEKLQREPSLEDLAGDLARLLEHLGVREPVHVVGLAMGAVVACAFAALYPAMARTLVLCDGTGEIDSGLQEYVLARAQSVRQQGMRSVVDVSLSRSYPAEVIRDRGRYEQYRARFLANDPESYAHLNAALARADVAGWVRRVRCPALVLTGEHDKIWPVSTGQKLAGMIQGAQFQVIAGGHFPPVQAPEPLVEAVTGYLRRF